MQSAFPRTLMKVWRRSLLVMKSCPYQKFVKFRGRSFPSQDLPKIWVRLLPLSDSPMKGLCLSFITSCDLHQCPWKTPALPNIHKKGFCSPIIHFDPCEGLGKALPFLYTPKDDLCPLLILTRRSLPFPYTQKESIYPSLIPFCDLWEGVEKVPAVHGTLLPNPVLLH